MGLSLPVSAIFYAMCCYKHQSPKKNNRAAGEPGQAGVYEDDFRKILRETEATRVNV
jgi:hypothetical protein